MNSTEWTSREKKVARAAFDAALKRELDALIVEFKKKAAESQDIEAVWKINNWLDRRRKEIDRTYDFRYSQLVFVFARLIERGVLEISELEGISERRLAEIHFLTNGLEQ
jgi:hypothetical protein